MNTEVIDLAHKRAQKLIEEGNALTLQHRYLEAKSLYAKSLEASETAEGYTFLAWMLSFEGMVQEAIDLCKRAIEVDPAFGNPYNDIGSYLIKLGKYDDAIPWLHKAIEAERYEPRQFPHMNLGQIYLEKKNWPEAEKEFRSVLKYEPSNAYAHAVLAKLQKEKSRSS